MVIPSPLFEGLPEEAIAQLKAKVLDVQKNSRVIDEGNEATALFVVVSGRLKVLRSDADGNELTLNTLAEGDIFGELALLDDKPRSGTVVALEPCRLLMISKDDFRSLVHHPDVALRLLQRLADKIRRLSDTAFLFATGDVFMRLRALLTDLAQPRDNLRIIEEPLTQREIASRIGCTRERVTAVMKAIVEGGYVEIDDRRRIVLRKELPQRF